MATSFKTLLSTDVTQNRTKLHEAIPLTGTILSGTYGTFGAETNIKNYSHGMFQSVYDYPYLSSSANHILDLTVGLYSGIAAAEVASAAQLNQKNDIYNQKKFYKPIKKLTLDDMYIEKTIKHLDFDKRKKYIVIGHSDGIYFTMEFTKQYPKLVKEIISLDGSWVTIKLCNQRLFNWKKKVKMLN